MIVKFWDFQKRINSTKQPSDQGVDLNVVLKNDTSILAPGLQLAAVNKPIYNYCYVSEFSRYYFIADWEWSDGLWTSICKVDPLASAKTNIGNFNTYIIRSASAFNGYISDAMYPGTTEKTITDVLSSVDMYDDTNGCYVIGVMGEGNLAGAGGIAYFALNQSQYQAFIDEIFMYVDNPADMTDLIETSWDPTRFIITSYYLPAVLTGTNSQIYVGPMMHYYARRGETAPMGSRLNNMIYLKSGSFSLSSHPQISRGQYLNAEPYTHRYLVTGPFGTIPLDSSQLVGCTSINWTLRMDVTSGLAQLVLTTNNNSYRIAAAGQLGVPIMITHDRTDYAGYNVAVQRANANLGLRSASAAITTAIGIASGNPAAIASGAGVMASALVDTQYINADTYSHLVPDYTTSGQQGNFGSLGVIPHLVSEFTHIASEDIDKIGRPLYEARTISTLSGYIKCANGDVPTSLTSSEEEYINNMLTGGFYYE